MSWGTICLDFLLSDTSPQLSSDLTLDAGINANASLIPSIFSYSGLTITNTLFESVSQGDLISKTTDGWVQCDIPVLAGNDPHPAHGIALEAGSEGSVIKILLFGVLQDPTLVLLDNNQYANGVGTTNEPPAFIQCVGRRIPAALPDTLLFDPDHSYLDINASGGGQS